MLWCSKTNIPFLFYNQTTRKDRNPTLKSLSAFHLQLTCMAEEERIICSFWLAGLFGVIYLLENLTFLLQREMPPPFLFFFLPRRQPHRRICRLPLFRQGGATVGLTTRLSAERDQGGFILIGRFVEAIRETSIRRDILSIPLLRWHLQLGRRW